MNNDYYKYKKYKKLYKKQKLTVGGTNNCNDIIKSETETDDEWESRCIENQLCVINNESRKCQANPNNITININEMSGESYPVMIHSPYKVNVLFRMLSQEKRRCKLFRGGEEEPLTMDEDLVDGEVIFWLPKPHVTPIMDGVALRGLVDSWCQGGFTEDDELLKTYGHISDWDVGNVTDMTRVFSGQDWRIQSRVNLTNTFNDDISEWNVINVTTMSYMFWNARCFNQSLHHWNISNVTNINDMFRNAISFNQPLTSWNVSNVTNMRAMFDSASSFNQPLNSWNVSNVTNMEFMFYNNSSFNQPLDSWNVSNVTNINTNYMFAGASRFVPNNAPWYNF